ncbi:MAG: preprotein translocase subunit SecG [Parvibaculales bacterium]
MSNVVLIVHLMIAIALILLVLLQRSEGGALGIGSGGGGGIMSGRGVGNVLSRATAILGVLFFISSITLAILSGERDGKSVFDEVTPQLPIEQGDRLPAPILPDIPPIPRP